MARATARSDGSVGASLTGGSSVVSCAVAADLASTRGRSAVETRGLVVTTALVVKIDAIADRMWGPTPSSSGATGVANRIAADRSRSASSVEATIPL